MSRLAKIRSLREIVLSDRALKICYFLARFFTGLTVLYLVYLLIVRISGEFEITWVYHTHLFRFFSSLLLIPITEILNRDLINPYAFTLELSDTTQEMALVSLSLALTF